MVDDDHPFAEFFDILHVVTRQHRGNPIFLAVVAQKVADLLLADHVQSDGGFIQEQDFWTVNQRNDQLHLHSLAETQFPDHDIEFIADIQEVDQLVDNLPELAFLNFINSSIELQ